MSLTDKELIKLVEDVKIGCQEIKQRKFTEGYKLNESDWKKLEEIRYEGSPPSEGAKVEIYWKIFDEPDIGYIFTLPISYDDDDIFISGIVHIPKPLGGEKCQNEAEWIYLGRLLSLSEVIKVKIIGR